MIVLFDENKNDLSHDIKCKRHKEILTQETHGNSYTLNNKYHIIDPSKSKSEQQSFSTIEAIQ